MLGWVLALGLLLNVFDEPQLLGPGGHTASVHTRITLQVDPAALGATLDVERKRIAAAGIAASVESAASDRIIVDAHVETPKDVDRLADMLARPGALTINVVDDAADPSGLVVGKAKKGRIAYPDDSKGGSLLVVYADPIITSQDLDSASTAFDVLDHPAVNFKLRPGAASKFGKATTQSIGKQIAIIVDAHVLSAPVVRMPITTGQVEVSGTFAPEEMRLLAAVLNGGQLPVPVKIIERNSLP